MKNLLCYFICFVGLIGLYSCEDDGTNGNSNISPKVKITIYSESSENSNNYYKRVELFFDGDSEGYLRRMFVQGMGNLNHQSVLQQIDSDVPLPIAKFGCLLKSFKYSNDSSFHNISRVEFDKEGYINKFYFDSFDPSNKSTYSIYKREGAKLVSMQSYADNKLYRISYNYYDVNGLCTLQVDSSIFDATAKRTINRYNDKKELDYIFWEDEPSIGKVGEFSYDNFGNRIKAKYYDIENNDTSNTNEYIYFLHRGYLIKQDEIDRFEFDSNNNIIGYIHHGYVNKRYKIEYTYY